MKLSNMQRKFYSEFSVACKYHCEQFGTKFFTLVIATSWIS